MPKIYKKHGSSVKGKVALAAIREKKTHAEICQEFSVSSSQISTWKKELEDRCSELFEGKQENNHKEEVERLHRIIGQITVERDFLEKALKR